MKLFVISRAQIVQKFACPRTAIAPVGIETWVEAERRTSHDRNQIFAGLELFELGVTT